MVNALIKRRVWIVNNRLLSTISAILILPVFLNVFINLPLKNIVVNPIWDIPYEQWSYPGLVMIVMILMMIPTISRDLFDLRIHKQLIPPLSLTPISKMMFICAFHLVTIIETVLYAIIVMVVLSVLIAPGFSIIDYLIMLPFIIIFSALAANLFITISLCINRTTLYNLVLLSIFTFMLFGSGLVIEFEYFPDIIETILRALPTGQIMQSMRMALFSGVINWLNILGALLIITAWAYLNGHIFQKVTKQ